VIDGFPKAERTSTGSGGYRNAGIPRHLSKVVSSIYSWADVQVGDVRASKGHLALFRIIAYFEMGRSDFRFWPLIDSILEVMWTMPVDECRRYVICHLTPDNLADWLRYAYRIMNQFVQEDEKIFDGATSFVDAWDPEVELPGMHTQLYFYRFCLFLIFGRESRRSSWMTGDGMIRGHLRKWAFTL
jgi:hypothetical protein